MSLRKIVTKEGFFEWSLERDLDPRPLPYQGNAPPGQATEAQRRSRERKLIGNKMLTVKVYSKIRVLANVNFESEESFI